MTVDPTLWAGAAVCPAASVPEAGAVGVELPAPATAEDAGTLRLILLRRDGDVRAYHNSCPHARAPLDFPPDKFFDITGRFLFCSLHGALFRPEDGVCVGGPAKGGRLTPIPVAVDAAGMLRVAPLPA